MNEEKKKTSNRKSSDLLVPLGQQDWRDVRFHIIADFSQMVVSYFSLGLCSVVLGLRQLEISAAASLI